MMYMDATPLLTKEKFCSKTSALRVTVTIRDSHSVLTVMMVKHDTFRQFPPNYFVNKIKTTRESTFLRAKFDAVEYPFKS